MPEHSNNKNNYEWVNIFRDKHLVNVVYLLIAMAFFASALFRIEDRLNCRFASSEALSAVKEDITRIEAFAEKRLDSLDKKIDTMTGVILRALK